MSGPVRTGKTYVGEGGEGEWRKERLEGMAKAMGFTYEGRGSLSRLFQAIAGGELDKRQAQQLHEYCTAGREWQERLGESGEAVPIAPLHMGSGAEGRRRMKLLCEAARLGYWYDGETLYISRMLKEIADGRVGKERARSFVIFASRNTAGDGVEVDTEQAEVTERGDVTYRWGDALEIRSAVARAIQASVRRHRTVIREARKMDT